MRKRHVNVLCTMIGGGGRRRRIFGILHELGAIHHEVDHGATSPIQRHQCPPVLANPGPVVRTGKPADGVTAFVMGLSEPSPGATGSGFGFPAKFAASGICNSIGLSNLEASAFSDSLRPPTTPAPRFIASRPDLCACSPATQSCQDVA